MTSANPGSATVLIQSIPHLKAETNESTLRRASARDVHFVLENQSVVSRRHVAGLSLTRCRRRVPATAQFSPEGSCACARAQGAVLMSVNRQKQRGTLGCSTLDVEILRDPAGIPTSESVRHDNADGEQHARMSEALPQVFLVRHGETAWTLSRQHTGRTDIPLTAQGERDAQALSARLQGMRFTTVLTSPLQRARRTAELAGFGERVATDADLMEWDYGEYEGRRTSEIRSERPGWRLFEDGCPSGETVSDLSARADRVVARIRAVSGDVLLFAHRDILRVLAARWVFLPARVAQRFYLETTSLSILGYDHDLDDPVIRRLNDARRPERREP
jgi:broad specificity phosphatase PhoE